MTFPPAGPRTRAAAALAALVLLAAGCNDSDPLGAPAPAASSALTPPAPGGGLEVEEVPPGEASALKTYLEQDLDWATCGGGFQCTQIQVPVDYSDPDGKTVKLEVTRLRTSGKKLGSLFINPGGPGASGVNYLKEAYQGITEPVRQRYDLVSFDPRGVGASKPVDCVTDRQLDEIIAADVTMDDPQDIAVWDRLAKDFAKGCAKNTGSALLAHVGTDDVARDLDLMRAVLGDEKLNYLGFSYGTYIGARYAELFPTKVGRLVLDGAVDPSLSATDQSLAQAAGFQRAWEAFVKACLDIDCPLGNKRGEVDSRLLAMFAKADDNPLRSVDGRPVSEGLATLGVVSAMYSPQRWEILRQALRAAYDGDGSGLLVLADAYLQRPGGRYSDNSNEAILAVNCLDHPYDEDIEAIKATVPEFQKASPLFGEFIAWGLLPCTYWEAPVGAESGPVRGAGAAPIVVIGTTRDPATPYEWAQALAGQLESGVFVSHDGDGHTVYGDGNRCIDRIVEDYLVNGEAPRDGVECD